MKSLFRSPVLLCLLLLFIKPSLWSQQQPVAELRGAWIATVGNIDWPSKPGLSPERQKIEFDSLLDVMKAMSMNAVFVQIRPAGDAFYKSASVPWSKYLSGFQGVSSGDSLYDPLEFMIKSAHARHMEFHAWLNPYRATFDLDTASLAAIHPLRALPAARRAEWFFRYGNKYYFNPANPLVVRYLTNVVQDIVLRYDIDGIHFDDYFYPYKEPNQVIDDYNQFAANPRGYTNIDDWRRNNVNALIEGVSKTIKKLKPYCKFGIGPFGVWRNLDKDPINGSDTRAAVTCYDDLYADVLLWLKSGWIDYVAPQVYWSIGYQPADYAKIVDWWSKHTYGRQLYIGHAAYKINNSTNDPNWMQPDQINRQIAINRANPNVHGSIFFSLKPLMRNQLGVQDSLIKKLYSLPALVPPMPALSKIPPATPQVCRVIGTPRSVKMAWHACEVLSGEEMPYYFGIYRFVGEAVGDFKDPRNLLAMTTFDSDKWTFEDFTALSDETYTYVLLAYNRLNVASYSSEPLYLKKTRTGVRTKRRMY